MIREPGGRAQYVDSCKTKGKPVRILLIEDHARLAGFIRKGLKAAQFDVDLAAKGSDALEDFECVRYDVVILDLGLPDIDGLELLNQLRAKDKAIPVLILTSRVQLADKIGGLNAGADDYLTKPFAMEELIARLHALLRRPYATLGKTLRAGNIELDVVAREAHLEGCDRPLPFSRRELSVLEQLMRRGGKVAPKHLMEQSLYGAGEDLSSNSVEVLVHRVRKKLTDSGANATIHTVRGIGYLMTTDEE